MSYIRHGSGTTSAFSRQVRGLRVPYQLHLSLPAIESNNDINPILRDLLTIILSCYRYMRQPAESRRRSLQVTVTDAALWNESHVRRELDTIIQAYWGQSCQLKFSSIALGSSPTPQVIPNMWHAPPRTEQRRALALGPDIDSVAAALQWTVHPDSTTVMVMLQVVEQGQTMVGYSPYELKRIVGDDAELVHSTLVIQDSDHDNGSHDWALLRAILTMVTAKRLRLDTAYLHQNGVDNLRLPVTIHSHSAYPARTVTSTIIDALNRIFALTLRGSPIVLHNPFILQTPSEVITKTIASISLPRFQVAMQVCRGAPLFRSQTAQALDLDLAASVSFLRDGHHAMLEECWRMSAWQEKFEVRTVTSFVAVLRQFQNLSESEATDAIARWLQGSAVANANPILQLCRRHLANMREILAYIIRCRSLDFVLGKIPAHSFLAHVISPDTGLLPASTQYQPTFRRRSDRWEIWYHSGDFLYMNHSKGFSYLHILLSNPNRSISARDLRAREAGGSPAPSNFWDVVLDDQAIQEYRLRLTFLRDELDVANENNDLGRQSRIYEEIEALESELARSVGLDGRSRRNGTLEKARKSVYIAIRRALERIQEQNEALFLHLSASLQLGSHPSYTPRQPVDWHT